MSTVTQETLALISELASAMTTLRQLHLAHAAFRLDATHQFRARKWFRTLVHGDVDDTRVIFQYMLPHGFRGCYGNLARLCERDGVCVAQCGGEHVHEYYYTHGRIHGTHSEWNSFGRLVSLGTYIAGDPYGTYIEWSNSGYIEYIGRYIAGNRHGACMIRYSSGCRKLLNYVNDKLHGEQTLIDVDGTIIEHCVYHRGEYIRRIS